MWSWLKSLGRNSRFKEENGLLHQDDLKKTEVLKQIIQFQLAGSLGLDASRWMSDERATVIGYTCALTAVVFGKRSIKKASNAGTSLSIEILENIDPDRGYQIVDHAIQSQNEYFIAGWNIAMNDVGKSSWFGLAKNFQPDLKVDEFSEGDPRNKMVRFLDK